MELHEELARRVDEIERTRENSARLAQVNAKFTTTGQGSIQFPKRVVFGLTYIEEPWLQFGCRVDVDEFADRLDIDSGLNDPVPLPVVTGFVTDWDRDDRDFYVGAWVAVRVYFPPRMGQDTTTLLPTFEIEVPFQVDVEIEHYFTFQGVAIKDVPLEGADD